MLLPRRMGLGILCIPAALGGSAPDTEYLDRYGALIGIRPDPGKVATVSGLVLRRDIGELTLEHGTLYLLTPVDGRTVGAVFEGAARFRMTPALAVERAQLARYTGAATLDDSVSRVVLLFSDSTPVQLAALPFAAGRIPPSIEHSVRSLIDGLKGDEDGVFPESIVGPLLNNEVNGHFLAHLTRRRGDPLIFEYNPDLAEPVQMHRPVRKLWWRTNWAVFLQSPPAGSFPNAERSGWEWQYRHRLTIPRYHLAVAMKQTGGADLDFTVVATFTGTAAESIGPWLRFGLHPKLIVDSARVRNLPTTAFFKAKEDGVFWVKTARLAANDTVTIQLFYHGNLIDRYGDWFYIDPSADWWPSNRQGRDWAMFDITYDSPSFYPMASVGTRTDSSVAGRVMTTRWVTDRPSPFATFNLGLFDPLRVQYEGAPSIEVLVSEEAHRTLRRQFEARGFYLPRQSKMREAVAADVSNSLKLFTRLFGAPADSSFFVTEIPYAMGVSFPGIIHLSWATFQYTSLDGFDEYFRAHEAAHQWWGNAVRPASYRDAWLAEGLATFSGLWYVQSVRKRNDEYFKFLDRYATNVRDLSDDVGAIWLGRRNWEPRSPGYHVVTYEKGAWVFHMLRTLMLDLRTRSEERFTEMLRDYHQTFAGQAASTHDFQRVVERHAGISMDWFFDQWVHGTALPRYRVAWKSEPADGGRFRVRLRVIQEGVPPNFQAPVLVSADLGSNRFAHFRVAVNGNEREYLGPLLPSEPRTITFNELQSVLADVKMERW